MKTTIKTTLTLLAVLSMSFLLTSCDLDDICERGKGTAVTETLTLPTFDGIDLSIDANVFITQDSVQSVEITAQENIIDLLELDVDSDGTWNINYSSCVRKVTDVEIRISVADLDKVKVTGSGNVTGQNRFNVADMDLDVTGSGNINLDFDGAAVDTDIAGSGSITSDLTATSITSKITGSGDMNMSGTADDLNLRISGSGDYNGFDLVLQSATIKITGSGDAEVNATQNLDVDISGSGSVTYDGSPQVASEITGSGSVKPK